MALQIIDHPKSSVLRVLVGPDADHDRFKSETKYTNLLNCKVEYNGEFVIGKMFSTTNLSGVELELSRLGL